MVVLFVVSVSAIVSVVGDCGCSSVCFVVISTCAVDVSLVVSVVDDTIGNVSVVVVSVSLSVNTVVPVCVDNTVCLSVVSCAVVLYVIGSVISIVELTDWASD